MCGSKSHPHACLYNIFLALTIYTPRYLKQKLKKYESCLPLNNIFNLPKGPTVCSLSYRDVDCRDLKLAFKA